MADISKGDEVTWNTSQGKTHGKVVEVKHAEFTFDGQKFKASDDEPYVIIESDKSGKKAAHKASSVSKK
ncbi:DUF2945 domain-containing protein [Jatrophihabitans sp. YIM 134969]